MKKGRPNLEQNSRKNVVKTIRYTAEEWDKIQDKLESSNLSYSAFIRKASFRVTITPVNLEAIKVLRNCRNDLVRIGNNINTIARNGLSITDEKSLNDFISDLRKCGDIAKELSEELDNIRRTIQ